MAGSGWPRGKNTNPCRGQFDSHGGGVHPANDGLNRSSDILAQLEPCLHVTGSISKSRAASDTPASPASLQIRALARPASTQGSLPGVRRCRFQAPTPEQDGRSPEFISVNCYETRQIVI
jgi:hypothetical protein